MKVNRCALYVFTEKKKDCFLVVLTREQESVVIGLVRQMHNGKIDCFKGKQPIKLLTSKEEIK